MKKILLLVCGLALFAGVSKAQNSKAEETTIIKVGMNAPAFTAKMLDGTEIKSADLKGKVVLLNFWATWCPPCRQEFARVQTDIVERFEGRDFVFLALSKGEDKATVKKFMEKSGYVFPVGADQDHSVYNLFASNYIPRNFVIDRDGKVVYVSTGYTADEFDKMISFIEGLL